MIKKTNIVLIITLFFTISSQGIHKTMRRILDENLSYFVNNSLFPENFKTVKIKGLHEDISYNISSIKSFFYKVDALILIEKYQKKSCSRVDFI